MIINSEDSRGNDAVPRRTTGPLTAQYHRALLTNAVGSGNSQNSTKDTNPNNDSNLASFYGDILDSVYGEQNKDGSPLIDAQVDSNIKNRPLAVKGRFSHLDSSLDPLAHLKNSNSFGGESKGPPSESGSRKRMAGADKDKGKTEDHDLEFDVRSMMRNTALEAIDGALQRKAVRNASAGAEDGARLFTDTLSKNEKRINVLTQMRRHNRLAIRHAISSPLPPILVGINANHRDNAAFPMEAISPGLYDLQTYKNTEINASLGDMSKYAESIEVLDLGCSAREPDTRVSFSQDVLCYSFPHPSPGNAEEKESAEPISPAAPMRRILPLTKEGPEDYTDKSSNPAPSVQPAPARKRGSSLFYKLREDGRPMLGAREKDEVRTSVVPDDVAARRKSNGEYSTQTRTMSDDSISSSLELDHMAGETAQSEDKSELERSSLDTDASRATDLFGKSLASKDNNASGTEEFWDSVVYSKTPFQEAGPPSPVDKHESSEAPAKDERRDDETTILSKATAESSSRSLVVSGPATAQPGKSDIYQDLLQRYLQSNDVTEGAEASRPGSEKIAAPIEQIHKPSPTPSYYSPLITGQGKTNVAAKSSTLMQSHTPKPVDADGGGEPTMESPEKNQEQKIASKHVESTTPDTPSSRNSILLDKKVQTIGRGILLDKKLRTRQSRLVDIATQKDVETLNKAVRSAIEEPTRERHLVNASVQTLESLTGLSGDGKSDEQDSLQEQAINEYRKIMSVYENHVSILESKISVVDPNFADKSRERLISALGSHDTDTDEKTRELFEYQLPSDKIEPANVGSKPIVAAEQLLDDRIAACWEDFAMSEFIFLENIPDDKEQYRSFWDDIRPAPLDASSINDGASISLRIKHRTCEIQEKLLHTQMLNIRELLVASKK